jgi:endonuclease YncB( thermonuclease family)
MNKDSVRGESTWTCSSLKSEERARLWAYGTLLAMICSNGCHAVPHGLRLYGGTNLWRLYRASVIKVLDGDTMQLDVHLWPDLTQRINLRLVGVNTPEKRGPKVSDCEKKAGQDATTFTQRWLQGVKNAKRSLWADAHPVPPWEFRRDRY